MKITNVPNIGVDANGVPYLIDQPDNTTQSVGTVLAANLFNPLFAEVANAIRLSGLALDNDNTQLYQVINKLATDIKEAQASVNNMANFTDALASLQRSVGAIQNELGDNNSSLGGVLSQLESMRDGLKNVQDTQAIDHTLPDYYPENHIAPPLLPGKHVWLNDPQPFLYDKDNSQYVGWYLYNEDDDTQTGTAWREVLTKDFINFTDNGVRIPKYTTDYGDVWSGCPYLDSGNLFGFGSGAVLYYITMPCDKVSPGFQSVSLWVAHGGIGTTPEFHSIVAANPDGKAFRDPKVFLGDDGKTLYMLISVTNGVGVLSSTDGVTWNRVSTFTIDNLGTIECPDLIKIGEQEVLIFSANGFEQAPATTQTMFLLVRFENGVLTLTQDRPSDVKRMCIDTGPDFYAGRCSQTSDGTNIMVAWANNWNYATNLPIAAFNGTLASPRTLSLHTFADGYVGVVGSTVANQASVYQKSSVSSAVPLSGDYSPIQFLDVPESCRIDFTIRKDGSAGWPNDFGVFIGSGDIKSFSTVFSLNGDGSGTGKPYFECTRNDYGARPMGSIKEWNEYYRQYIDGTPDTITVTYIIDHGTAEVFVNGIYAQTFLVLWPIGTQFLRMSIPKGFTLSGDCTLCYNRRPGRVNGAFTRAHADSLYLFNDYPGITSYDGDSSRPFTKRVRQICYDTNTGPFLQMTYGGEQINFWQIHPDLVDKIVVSNNSGASQIKQIFLDSDASKGVGVELSPGSGSGQDTTVYLVTQDHLSDVQKESKEASDTNSRELVTLKSDILAIQKGGSPNTAADPALLDRYALTTADVAKFLHQSAELKAQGQSYAGRYALTPQVFENNSDGLLKLTPYGPPPTDGITTTHPESYPVPIITDSCSQYYDASTGIHYRWDQFQASSKTYEGAHWSLDGPVLSVSLDGLSWASIRTILYNSSGGSPKTGFFIDRDNRFGHGSGTLIVSGTDGTYALPTLVAAGGTRIGESMCGEGDHRVYYDPDVFKNMVTLSVNSSNTHLLVRTGLPGSLHTEYTIDDSIFSGLRVECPSWIPMYDQATGTKMQVVAVAVQNDRGQSITTNYETLTLGAGTYTQTGMSFSSDLRFAEWGAYAYAHILVDPLQQDGTGGTRNGCDTAVMNVGCYNWHSLNGNWRSPAFGFAGGQWIPADVVLRNGVPYLLPNSKFNDTCQGFTFSESASPQGSNATNNGWTLGVTHRSDVWRAEMEIANFTFTGTTTIRFHFGSCYTDYVFGNGVIDIHPNNSGTTVLFPNNGGSTARVMPLTRPFVQGQGNTLVWEYDNGRIRLYNTATGEVMSEMIYPDGYQLSTVEVIGNDLFVGGFTFTVKQDQIATDASNRTFVTGEGHSDGDRNVTNIWGNSHGGVSVNFSNGSEVDLTKRGETLSVTGGTVSGDINLFGNTAGSNLYSRTLVMTADNSGKNAEVQLLGTEDNPVLQLRTAGANGISRNWSFNNNGPIITSSGSTLPEMIGMSGRVVQQVFTVVVNYSTGINTVNRVNFPTAFKSGTTPMVFLQSNAEENTAIEAHYAQVGLATCVANDPNTYTPLIENTGFSYCSYSLDGQQSRIWVSAKPRHINVLAIGVM